MDDLIRRPVIVTPAICDCCGVEISDDTPVTATGDRYCIGCREPPPKTPRKRKK